MRRTSSSSAIGLALLVLGCEGDVGQPVRELEPPLARASALPGPASSSTRFDPARLALDRECRACHVEAAAQWQHSQHASAWSSRAFQRAFASEARPFCQGCHAPETATNEPVPRGAAELGVGCVTCHVQSRSEVELEHALVLTGLAEDTGALAQASAAPHPIARSASFTSPHACAGCHEFEFPDAALRDEALLMQATLTEHGDSDARDRTCVDCHMPLTAGGRSHAFPGAYDPAMLGRALDIAVTRPSPALVRVELRPGQVGHAVPTGDLLRRLEVALVEGERVLDRDWLDREFADRRQSNSVELREQIGDDRVGIGEPVRVVELRVPDRPTGPLRWRVVHQRVANHARDPRAAAIEGAIEIASGPVPSGPW